MKDEIIFCFSDIKKIFLDKIFKIFLIGFLFFITALFLVMKKDVKYKTQATFHDASNANSRIIKGLDDFIMDVGTTSKTKASSIMKSRKMISTLVKKLNLQARVVEEDKLSNLFVNMKRNLKIEMGLDISDSDDFEFEDVEYFQDKKKIIYLRFLSSQSFEILDSKKHFLQLANIKQRISFEDLSFIVKKIPNSFTLKKYYKVVFLDKDAAISKLLSTIEVNSEKLSPQLLTLECFSQNKYLAAKILNTLIDSYQDQQKEESEELSFEQLNYLEKRQRELNETLAYQFDEYESYLKQNIEKTYFLDAKQDAQNTMASIKAYLDKIQTINLEIDFLKYLRTDQKYFCSDQALTLLQQEIDTFTQKKDSLLLSNKSFEEDINPKVLNQNIEDLRAIQANKMNLQHFLSSFEKQKDLDVSSGFSNIYSQAKEIIDLKDFQKYLKEHIHLLTLQETLLKQKALDSQQSLEFVGKDTDTLKKLFLEYNSKKNAFESSIAELNHILIQIEDPKFEISSLSSFLYDSVSVSIIKQISDLSIKLYDEDNFLKKEKIRIKNEIYIQKKFLKEHLCHLIDLKKINLEYINEKIFLLKKAELQLINQHIAQLRKRSDDYIKDKCQSLENEKALIENQKNILQEKMLSLPQKYNIEKKLNLQTDMAMNMIQSLTKLAESKTIDHNLSRLQSKAIDLAIIPKIPIPPRLKFYSLIAFIFGITIAFIFFLYKSAAFGFIASIDNLSVLNQVVCGKLSSTKKDLKDLTSKELETLRKIALSIDHKMAVLIGSGGPNYSHLLASLLSKRKKSVLVIDTSYVKSKEMGLFHYLEKKIKKLPIKNKKDHDFLPTGGSFLFAEELLDSKDFKDILKNVKSKYDLVLIYTHAKPLSSEADIYLKLADSIVVSFKEEKLNDLAKYLKWSDQKDHSLSFVTF